MALEYVEPGMQLARDIYDLNGRTILASGMFLTDKHLAVLQKWGIRSIYVDNPILSLPPIDEVVEEASRLRAAQAVKAAFEKTEKSAAFELTRDQKEIVNDIVRQVLKKRLSIIHLAQIQRHHDNLFAHSINVSILATLTAVSMGINNSQDLYTISIGALLHDIGKVAVPQRILEKSTALTPEETEVYNSHTTLGYDLLRKTNELPLLACHIALQHHERMDGQGYPRKIGSADISHFARIVCIANEYDNLLVDRPEHKSVPPHLAYETIVAGVNTTFDPEVAQAFLSRIALYPIGTMVKLKTGHIGIVAAVIAKIQHRPVLKIIADAQGVLVPNPYMVDLADKENLTLFIDEVVSDAAAVEFLKRNK
jgi:putative nucleotidyltransferase with HDIG domain